MSPNSYLRSGVLSSSHIEALTQSRSKDNYKPKYKNLRDAYDEFKALKKASQKTTLRSDTAEEEEVIRIASGTYRRIGKF